MNTPYMVGRRASAKPVAGSASVQSLRAEDSGNTSVLRTVGWSTATFGSEAILGWLAKTRRGNR
jgi:hypothetical protein